MKTKSLKLEALTEVCLYCKDLELSSNFYQNILGVSPFSTSENHVFFRISTQVLLLFDPEYSKQQTHLPSHFAEGHQHIAFTARPDDYELWKKHVESQNVNIDKEHLWEAKNLKSFYFRDPDGHVLEILEGNIWI